MGSSVSCQVEIPESPALPSLCPTATAPGRICTECSYMGAGNTSEGGSQKSHIPVSRVRRVSSEQLCADSSYCLCGIHNCATILHLAGSPRVDSRCLLPGSGVNGRKGMSGQAAASLN